MEWIIISIAGPFIVGGIFGAYDELRKIRKNSDRILELLERLDGNGKKFSEGEEAR